MGFIQADDHIFRVTIELIAIRPGHQEMDKGGKTEQRKKWKDAVTP